MGMFGHLGTRCNPVELCLGNERGGEEERERRGEEKEREGGEKLKHRNGSAPGEGQTSRACGSFRGLFQRPQAPAMLVIPGSQIPLSVMSTAVSSLSEYAVT